MNRIKELRHQNRISQKQLAIDLKLSQPTVCAWEKGTKVPSSFSAARLADYFDVSMDYLLGRSNEPHDKLPATSDDDGLRSEIISRISALPDQYLPRVLSYLDGIRAGLDIQALQAADRDPDPQSKT